MRPTSPITHHNQQHRQLAADRQRRQELRGQPSRYAGGSNAAPIIITEIEGNDTIATVAGTTIKGIMVASLSSANYVEEVPNADPSAVSVGSLTAGLGLGDLDGETVYVAYWCRDPDEVAQVGAWAAAIPDDAVVYARRSVSLPVTGDAETVVPVYLVDEAW